MKKKLIHLLLCAFLSTSIFAQVSKESAPASNADSTQGLKPKTKDLGDVVVIGYGSSKKRDLTGSNLTVSGTALSHGSYVDPMQALQGAGAGIQVIQNGQPGAKSTVRIRGVGSIMGGADPLYVVDGVLNDDIRNINTSDIESIDVLKDASSTAIYGARGANGVIVVTTKSGKFSSENQVKPLQIKVSSLSGITWMNTKVDMLQMNGYASYVYAASDGGIRVSDTSLKANTNWMNEVTQIGFMSNTNVSASQTFSKYFFYASVGYTKDLGILKGDNTYERYVFHLNQEFKIAKGLKIGDNLNLSSYKYKDLPGDVFTQAYREAPIYKPVINGVFQAVPEGLTNVGNPVATLAYKNAQSSAIRLQNTLWGEYKWKDFSFRTSFGADIWKVQGYDFVPIYHVSNSQKSEKTVLTYSVDTAYQWVWDQVLTYSKKIDKHKITALLGHTAEKRDHWNYRSTKENVDPNLRELSLTATAGGQTNLKTYDDGNYFTRESFFARVNYVYDLKYLLNATIRRDANSNFSEKNRWATFPSIGLGWILSEETFMQYQNIVDLLKVRASYGVVGNDVVRAGQFSIVPDFNQYSYNGTTLINGASVAKIYDPNLTWENVQEIDLGIESDFFKNRLRIETDYYEKTVLNAIFTVPYLNVGFGQDFITNAASISNKGYEIAVKWRDSLPNQHIKYNAGISFSSNTNVVTNVGLGKPLNYGYLGDGNNVLQTLEGQPIGSFWLYQSQGIYQTQAEVDNSAHLDNARPGDFRIKDVNGDGKIDSKDKGYVGTYQPKYFYSIILGCEYKNFDISMNIYGVGGNKIYNAKKALKGGSNWNVEADYGKSRWTGSGSTNAYPRATISSQPPVDYFLEDGDYIRLNNLTIGYTLPAQKWKYVESFRVFLAGNNLLMFSKYSGFTPEIPGATANDAGVELGAFPIVASLNIGFDIQLK